MNPATLSQLLAIAAERPLTDNEFSDLLLQLEQPAATGSLGEGIFQAMLQVREPVSLDPDLARSMLTAIWQSEQILEKPAVIAPHRIRSVKPTWLRYAAIFLLVAGTATYLYRINRPQQGTTVTTPQKKTVDILPGSNKAILTLADGSTIVLDSTAHGSLAQQGNTDIIQLDAGSLAYHAGTTPSKQVLYNTISTPKGGQYQLVLPDGTRVWLNAASSIRFPVAFNEKREVVVTGEAYLEVAQDKKKPFSVASAGQTIHVIGTSFNINAYEDEVAVRTTLTEGGIVVEGHQSELRLIPGQQSVLNGQLSLLKNADVNQVIAWKNGSFNFNRLTVKDAMKQLARWYDVEVKYEPGTADQLLGGEMGRNLSLQQMIRLLNEIGLHFTLKDRTVYVTP